MSISIMITAEPKDLEIISDTILTMQYLIMNPDIIPGDDQVKLTQTDINRAYDYFLNIYNILTTTGMTIQQYEESISSNSFH